MSNELYHHGVKGMKWGVRNDPELIGGHRKKVKTKDLPASKKSNHRRELELRYRQAGMDRKTAIEKADKRIRVEKILAITGGVTVAAAATAVAVNKYKERTQGIRIPEGISLQRMIKGDASGQKLNEHEFYATYNKKDNLTYWRYAWQMQESKGNQLGSGDFVSKLNISKKGGFNIATDSIASKEFGRLWKSDPDFRKDVLDSLPKSRKVLNRGGNKRQREAYMAVYRNRHNDNPSVKELKQMYDAWNIAIPFDHGESSQRTMSKMRGALKSKGFHGIVDVNDSRYSGFKASRPIIAFADANADYKVKDTKLNPKTVNGMHYVSNTIIGYNNSRKQVKLGSLGAASAGIAGGTLTFAAQQQIIKKYKQDHPNTRLTNSQIINSYKKNNKKK